MAELYFKIGADWENVKRLQEEIKKLEEQLKKFGSSVPETKVKEIEKSLGEMRRELKKTAKEAAEAGASITGSLKKLGASYLSVQAIKDFGAQVIRIRGEFQDMETSIETLVGKTMANKLIPQIKELAKVSPLTMSDMVGAEKMMLGFNIEADKTITYLRAISDVSMGSAQKFNSLTLAFSQMSAAGKLMGQDLNQMINAGFNPLQQISKTTGKSIAELKEEMSKGAVSAEMVQQAFLDATSAGGKFYKMSENASKTINGQLSMLEDSFDAVFNEIGTKSESFIIQGIQTTTTLVENYETLGKVIGGLIATYGIYKASLLAVMAIEKLHVLSRVAAITHTNLLAVATGRLAKAMAGLNLVTKMNPYVLLATTVAAAGAALWALHDSTTAEEQAAESLAKKEEQINTELSTRIDKATELVGVISDEATAEDDKLEALVKLETKYPDIFAKYDTEAEKLANIRDILKEIIDYEKERAGESTKNIKSDNEALIRKLEKEKAYYDNKYEDDPLIKAQNISKSKEIQKQIDTLKAENRKMAQKEAEERRVKLMTSENLANLSDEQLEKAIKERKQIQAKINHAKTDEANKNKKQLAKVQGYNAGIKDEETLQSEINQFEAELNKRKAPKKTSKQWEAENKKALEKAEKALEDFKNNSNEKLTQEEYNKELKRLQDEVAKAKKKLGSNRTTSGKSNKKTATENELETRQLLLDAREETNETLLEQIQLDYDKQIAEIAKQEKKLKKERGGYLSKDESDLLDAKRKKAEYDKNKALADIRKEELVSMREYLKEYGTLKQQELAITEEYDEKIKKAKTEGEKKILQQEKNAAIGSAKINAAQEKINWSGVFGNFGSMFKAQLEPTLKELREIAKGADFKAAPLEEQKILYDIIHKLEQSGTVWDGDIFVKMSQDLENYQSALAEYERVQKSATATEEEKIRVGQRLAETQSKLNATTAQAEGMFQSLADGIQGLASGSLQGIGEGLMKLDQIFTDGEVTKDVGNALAKGATKLFGEGSAVAQTLSASLGSTGTIGVIISAVLSILDIFKDGIGTVIAGMIDTVLSAIANIIKNILTFEFAEQVITAVADGIAGILDAITFGGFTSWLDTGNGEEVKKAIDRLTDRNEVLTYAIDNLTEALYVNRGAQTVADAEEALKYQEEKEQNLKGIAQAQAGYHSAHHSWNYYWDGFSSEFVKEFSKRIGRSWSGDIWDLTSKEMQQLLSNPEISEMIKNTGEGKYGENVLEKLRDYAAEADKAQEIIDQLNETLTGMSFDSFYDSFIESVMDASKSAQEIVDEMAEHFQRSILEYSIGEAMYEDLKAWYEKYAEYAKEGLTKAEIGELKALYETLVRQGQEKSEQISQITGYNHEDSGSATAKSIENITTDQANALEGILTATQIAVEQGNDMKRESTNALTMLNVKMDDINRLSLDTKNTLDGISDMLADSYLELQGINSNTKPLKSMSEDLSAIKKILNDNY